MNIIYSFAFGILLALLINLPFYFNQRRLLRLSNARLELSRAVTTMDQLMLDGKIKAGEACHDGLYQVMLKAQYEVKTYRPVKLWIPPSKQSRTFFMKLHRELSEHGELAAVTNQFVTANGQVLCNAQPIVSKIFAAYVLIFCGGLNILLAGLRSLLKAQATWVKFRQLIAEWSLVLQREPSPQFKARILA